MRERLQALKERIAALTALVQKVDLGSRWAEDRMASMGVALWA